MSYTPQPGSAPYMAIVHFRDGGVDLEMTSAELAAMLGFEDTGPMVNRLKRVVEAEFLKCRSAMKDGRMQNFYRLGPNGARLTPEGIDPSLPVRQETVQASAMPSIFAYAMLRDAAPFSVALTSDGRMVFERYGRTVLELTRSESKATVEWIDRNLEAFVPRQAEVAA